MENRDFIRFLIGFFVFYIREEFFSCFVFLFCLYLYEIFNFYLGLLIEITIQEYYRIIEEAQLVNSKIF
jgi:hypothetical protein